jgi:hypothetical protein
MSTARVFHFEHAEAERMAKHAASCGFFAVVIPSLYRKSELLVWKRESHHGKPKVFHDLPVLHETVKGITR